MLHPKSLIATNFKSFRSLEDFKFPSKPGLTFLTGENRVDTGLSSNGVGKSTLFDALHWLLYGTSARGLRAGNICSWGESSGTRVVSLIGTSDGDHEVVRTWRPNSLKVNGEETGQEELEQLIGLNSLEFRNSVLMGQFNPFFLDLKPADKLNLFTSVMDLEFWTDISTKASILNKDLETQDLPHIRAEVAKIQGLVEYQVERIEQLKKESAGFARHRFAELRRMEEELKGKESDHELARTALREAAVRAEEVSKEAQELEELLEGARGLKSEYSEEISSLQEELVRARGKLGLWLEELESREETVCPTCGQDLPQDEELQQQVKVKLEGEVAALRKEVRDKKSTLDNLQELAAKEEEEFEGAVAELRAAWRESSNNLRRAEDLKSKASLAANSVDNSVRALKARIHETANTENRAAEELERVTAEQKSNLNRLEALNEDLKQTETMQRAASFWIRGFRDVRLFLVEEALTSLEMESNQALFELGLPDWRIAYDIEKETQSGGVSKGFSVVIDSPISEGVVPWEAWSGGEGQRLRLAANLGLANLIQDRKGVHSFLEVWDEPSQHLSEKGVEDLLDVLSSRAYQTGKSVWVVDHHSLSYGGFDSTYRVIKDSKNGSWIE